MLHFLKNHPFAVDAFFESSVVLTFAVPHQQLQGLVPECLELDIFNDKWAFVAVAMVQTRDLRPRGFPRIFGNNFFLVGYRIFVKYRTSAGKRLRGLYILKSETDKKKMEFFGNLFTHYHYSTTDIRQTGNENGRMISSEKSGFHITISQGNGQVGLPPGSPFADWAEARRYAGPLPFTFTVDPMNKTVLIIEGVRQNWNPAAIPIDHYSIRFLDQLNLEGMVLANAFEIKDIPYQWKKGVIDKWN